MYSSDQKALSRKAAVFSRFGVVFLAALFSALLLSVSLSGQAEAADLTAGSSVEAQAVKYNLWVGGKQVTSANASNVLGDGHVKYNARTQTLTLKNAKIKKGRSSGTGNSVLESISYKMTGTFTIKLLGNNTISAPKTSNPPVYAYGIADWASNSAKLRFTGTGSLTVRAAGASRYSQAIAVWKGMTVQDKVKLYCYGGMSTEKSTGIEVVGGLVVKGSAKIVASGESGAFTKAPKFSGYTPKVKAGYSASSIRVNKKKPASSTYTKYPYVSITKASSSASSSKKPGKLTITKVSPGSNLFWIYWKAPKKCTGYEMQVSENKKFPSNLTYNWSAKRATSKTTAYTYIYGLSSGHTYYVRMRAYNVSGGKTYHGVWTGVKKVRISGGSVG